MSQQPQYAPAATAGGQPNGQQSGPVSLTPSPSLSQLSIKPPMHLHMNVEGMTTKLTHPTSYSLSAKTAAPRQHPSGAAMKQAQSSAMPAGSSSNSMADHDQ